MTNNDNTDHDKNLKNAIEASQNVDSRLIDIVRLLARNAAQSDFEEQIRQEQSNTTIQ